MLRPFFGALLCVVVVGKVHAQEVIVAHEKKPEVPTPTVQPLEQISSETPTPTPPKSKPAKKKSVPARLTLEEMREAGERAAEGLNDRPVSQSTKSREPESIPAPNPTVLETPRPVKKGTQTEERSASRPSKSRTTNPEGIGPIRPTMMESGREPPPPSPSGR